jgi:protein gp37
MRLAAQLEQRGVKKYQGLTQIVNGHPVWTGKMNLDPQTLQKPYTWKKPVRVFVNSMSDLFHEGVPDSFLSQVFAVMNDLPQHTFQILTKRPERAAQWAGPWTKNIWMGTSVEDRRVIHRIDHLRQCQAQTRFLSIEPLIGALGKIDLAGIHWAIVGGESGPGYRPMPHAWAREIRDQCLCSNVAFFFKQSAAPRTEMGTSLRHEDGTFWTWQQYPGELSLEVAAAPHKYAGE